MDIPFISFDKINAEIKQEAFARFENFFDAQHYVLGGHVKKFEIDFANYCQADYCIGVGNGLDALRIALLALEIREGDEVIVPSNTYIATVLAVSHTGATPVFVEPDDTYTIDPNRIEEKITTKTKAIIPVHLYGQPCAMVDIMTLATKYKLYVVEDNAQSHGAKIGEEVTGGIGHINATSFYPTKNLGALGDGGAITTNDKTLAEKCQLIRNYGSIEKNIHQVLGYNSRLDELQASILSAKLPFLDKWNFERKEISKWYHSLLQDVQQVTLPLEVTNTVHHLFVIRVAKRDALKHYLEQNGVQTMIHYPTPPHLQPAYQPLGYKLGDFPMAEQLAATSLSLPLFVGMTKNQVRYVTNLITDFFD